LNGSDTVYSGEKNVTGREAVVRERKEKNRKEEISVLNHNVR